jgi:hypothetical protein
MNCPNCGTPQREDHRFCPRCGESLADQADRAAAKVTQLFLGLPDAVGAESDSALRVSRYRQQHEFVAPEGTVHVHDHHVRLSIWVVDRPVCAISLSDDEALRLAEFLTSSGFEHALDSNIHPSGLLAQASGERADIQKVDVFTLIVLLGGLWWLLIAAVHAGAWFQGRLRRLEAVVSDSREAGQRNFQPASILLWLTATRARSSIVGLCITAFALVLFLHPIS